MFHLVSLMNTLSPSFPLRLLKQATRETLHVRNVTEIVPFALSVAKSVLSGAESRVSDDTRRKETESDRL